MGIDLDLVDLALFDFIRDFIDSGRSECASVNGKPYFWISPSYIIQEMPILGIKTTRGINLRIEKLISEGMLLRGPENKSKRRTYIAFGPRVGEYFFGSWNENSKSLGTEIPRDYSTTDYNKINIVNKDADVCDSALFDEGEGADCHEEPTPTSSKRYIEMRGIKVPPSGDIETRDAQFKAWCFEYLGEFDEGLIMDLYLKYSQPDRQGKLLFETEKSWDMHKRLLYWKRCREKRNNRFKRQDTFSEEPERKDISAQEALKRAGWI